MTQRRADTVEMFGKRFTKEEWWDVCRKMYPDKGRAEFEKQWKHNMAEKTKRARKAREN